MTWDLPLFGLCRGAVRLCKRDELLAACRMRSNSRDMKTGGVFRRVECRRPEATFLGETADGDGAFGDGMFKVPGRMRSSNRLAHTCFKRRMRHDAAAGEPK